MSWLRIDDRFTENAKISALNDRDLRVWLRVLCYCSRHEDPTIDTVTIREVVGLTRKRVERYHELGLVDHENGAMLVHDWEKYRPKDQTGAERQSRWRAKQTAGSNGQHVTSHVTEPVTENVISTVTKPSLARAPSRPEDLKDPSPSSVLQDAGTDGRTALNIENTLRSIDP